MTIARMKKNELKAELKTFGYSNDQLDAMKQPELREKLTEEQKGSEGLDVLSGNKQSGVVVEEDDDDIGVAVVQDTEKVGDTGIEDIPSMMTLSANVLEPPRREVDQEEMVATVTDPPTPNDKEWTQYVLGQFAEDEVDGKNPRVEGLRRVAGLLIGTIVEEGCDLVAPPTEENNFRACVKAWFIFDTPTGLRRSEALADAHRENCLEDYATYLVAMADTRAKGRVLRNILGLRRVVAAEEVSKTMAPVADTQKGGHIHAGKIALIRMIADRNHFDLSEIFTRLEIPFELNKSNGEVDLQSLSYDDAVATLTEMRLIKEEKEKSE